MKYLKQPHLFIFWAVVILFFNRDILWGNNQDKPGNSPALSGPGKNDRLLGIDILQIPENGTYAENLTKAINELHADEIHFSFDWNQLENPQGTYDLTPFTQLIGTYWDKNIKLSLIFRAVDTAGTTIPSRNGSKKSEYDFTSDPEAIISRFNTLLTRIYNHKVYGISLNDKIYAIHIGNEIDCYLGNDPVKWANYKKFYEAARAKVKQLWGDRVIVSTVSTYQGLTDPWKKPRLKELYKISDAVVLTYYPQYADFTVKAPQVVESDFALLTSEYGFKPILIQECGYQSSPVCGSSEEMQALFIKNVFTAWDKYQTWIKLISFSWLYDISEAAAEHYIDWYGLRGAEAEQKFKHYLWSLGLCTYGGKGTEKKAYKVLVSTLKERGW